METPEVQVPGLDLNCRDVHGLAALHWAVASNRAACVSVLRSQAGLDWNVRTDPAGWYPLTLAVEKGRADILQIILSVPEPHLDLSVTDSRGRNIAQIAEESERGERERCLELLRADRRVDWRNVRSRKIELVQSVLNNIDAGQAEWGGLTELMENKHSELEISGMKEMINSKRREMKARYEEQMRSLDRLESQLWLEMEETSEEYMECSRLEIRAEANIKQEMLEIDERDVEYSVEMREPDIKQEHYIQQPARFIKTEPVNVTSENVSRTEPELDLMTETSQTVADPVPGAIPSPPPQSEPQPSDIYSNKEIPRWVLRPWVNPANNIKGNVNVELVEGTIIKDII